MFEDYKLKYYNFRIIIYILALSVIGVLLIYSATNSSSYYEGYYKRQIFGIAVGCVAMIVMSHDDSALPKPAESPSVSPKAALYSRIIS